MEINLPRHIVWSTDRVDLDDPFQRKYYLGHRVSFDLDLFTGVEELILPVSYQLEKLSSANLQISVVRRFATYVEFLVTQNQENLKVVLAFDSPFRFEPPILTTEGIWANTLRDLQVDNLPSP